MSRYDIAIVGAGMAGASLAAEIGDRASVMLLEAEAQPGYHSTGRSAAFWSETYGGPLVQPLTTASGHFLRDPPAEFSDRGFLRKRGALHLADADGEAALEKLWSDFEGGRVQLEPLYRSELLQGMPHLKSGWNFAIRENSCADIDVAGLHAAYLRQARKGGVVLACGARLTRIARAQDSWRLETRAGSFTAGVLVSAAGAWADEVAGLAGVPPLGIQPYRRTIAQLRVSPPAPADLPLVIDALGRFYFKPEAGGRLWLSPHDETACDPCDAAAEEIDVAVAIDRLEQVVDWKVERVERSWAGLRSFAPDRLPAIGYEKDRSDFFWFAGQGGFGIQTAPAAARLAAALLLRTAPEAMVAGIDPAPYDPARFRY